MNEKAVEAGARALSGGFHIRINGEPGAAGDPHEMARAVLEAAHPEIIAEVVEALREVYQLPSDVTNPGDFIERRFGVSP